MVSFLDDRYMKGSQGAGVYVPTSDDPSSNTCGWAVPSHTFTFAFLEGVPVLSLCLTVINTPIYYELTKHRFHFSLPGKFAFITPNQGNESAVQTLLYKLGVTC